MSDSLFSFPDTPETEGVSKEIPDIFSFSTLKKALEYRLRSSSFDEAIFCKFMKTQPSLL